MNSPVQKVEVLYLSSPVEKVEVLYLNLLDKMALCELQPVGRENDHVHQDQDCVLGESHTDYPVHNGHYAPKQHTQTLKVACIQTND
jgi:hypothetical protein